MRPSNLILFCIGALLLVGIVQCQVAENVNSFIDTFAEVDVMRSFSTSGSPDSLDESFENENILGGERNFLISWETSVAGIELTFDYAGTLTVNASAPAQAQATFSYDGIDGSIDITPPGLEANLTGSVTGIVAVVDFYEISDSTSQWTVSLTGMQGGEYQTCSLTLSEDQAVAGSDSGVFYFPIALFGNDESNLVCSDEILGNVTDISIVVPVGPPGIVLHQFSIVERFCMNSALFYDAATDTCLTECPAGSVTFGMICKPNQDTAVVSVIDDFSSVPMVLDGDDPVTAMVPGVLGGYRFIQRVPGSNITGSVDTATGLLRMETGDSGGLWIVAYSGADLSYFAPYDLTFNGTVDRFIIDFTSASDLTRYNLLVASIDEECSYTFTASSGMIELPYGSIIDEDCPARIFYAAQRIFLLAQPDPDTVVEVNSIAVGAQPCALTEYLYFATSSCVPSCPGGTVADDTNRVCALPFCASDQYLNETTLTCEYCSDYCATCFGPSSLECSSCAPNHYLDLSDEYECVIECPTGYFASDVTNTCRLCDFSCASCQDSFDECTSCFDDSYLFNSTCGSSCPTGFYADDEFNECVACDNSCVTCDGPTEMNCTSCAAGLSLLEDGSCSSCPAGQYADEGNECQYCDISCLECSGATPAECTACNVTDGGFLLSGYCYYPCPTGFYGDVTTGDCLVCDESCDACESGAGNGCTACSGNLYLLPDGGADSAVRTGVCTTDCGTGAYEDASTNECMPCDDGCLDCFNDGSCASCNSTLFYDEGSCVETCGSGYYGNTTTRICDGCDPACAECNGALVSQCTVCNEGYYLEGSTCVNTCMVGSFRNETGNTCDACDVSCTTCDGPSDMDCVSCTLPLYLNMSQCASTCPLGTFADDATATCRPCFDLCETCTGTTATECLSCVDGAILVDGECDHQCDDNQFLSGGVCVDCDASCATCRGSTASDCTSCSVSTLLEQGTCVASCSRGFYEQAALDSCLPCDVSCGACDGPSFTECLECDGDLYLNPTGACVSDCPVGRYAEASNNTCVLCSIECADCQDSATDCTACVGSFLQDSTCVSSCAAGTYGDATTATCLECDDSCASCSGPLETDCLACSGGDFLNPSGLCLSSCPAQFYGMNNLCQACNAPCFTCDGAATCTACNSGFFLIDFNDTCVTTCPQGLYADADTSRCLPCNDACAGCTGPMENECTACDTGFVLIDDMCESTCPMGQYFDSESLSCSNCDSSCLTCNGRFSSECTSCNTTYLEEGQCVSSCSGGNFASDANMLCLACDASCETCEGTAVNCTSCPQFNFLQEDNTCATTCPSDMYGDMVGRICMDCDSSCSTCSGPSDTECITCAAPFFLDVTNSSCVSMCPSDTYADVASRTCVACYPYCETCSGPLAGDCLTCPSIALFNDGECVYECNFNQFPNVSAPAECLDCDSNCASCAVSATACTSCSVGTFLSNDACIASCPAGTYADTTLRRCVACNQGCETCSGPSATECLTCPTGFLLDGTSCIDQCGVGQYRNEATSSCLACDATCRTCSLSSSNCLSCPSGRVLEENRCVIACSDGFYLNSTRGTCTPCDPSCETCIGPADTQCRTCPSISTFNNGECVVNCPVGFFTQDLACATCSSNCRTCAGAATTCTSCNSGSYLSGTQCVLSCPDLTYGDRTTNQCVRCDSSCDSCDGPTRFDCLSCPDNFFLNSDGRCLSTCPTGFFGTNGRCAACNTGCLNCTGSTAQECLSCASGLVLEDGQCVSACSAGSVRSPGTSVCVPCADECATCGPSPSQCLTCDAPRFLENSACVTSCTGGYRDTTTRTCQSCDSTCATCSGALSTQCVSCPSTRALYDNRCVLSCPTGTTESNGVCLERDCDPNATGYTSTVTSQVRSTPTYTDAGEPVLAQILCAFGNPDEACLISGALLEETITTSFSISATVVCTQGCNDPVTRTFTKDFQATSVVSRNDYRLIAAINPSASNFESVAQSYLAANSEQLQAFYRSADNIFEQDLDQNRRFVCDGSRLSDPQVNTLQRRDARLADVNGSYGSLCSAEPYADLPLIDRRSTRRCVCDGSVSSISSPCAQVQINDGAPAAVCHPNQCSTEVSQFIQIILDTPYATFGDSALGQVITQLTAYMNSNTFPSSGKTVVVQEVDSLMPLIVSRFDANGQTVIQFYLQGTSGVDVANMQQLYSDFVIGRVVLSYDILRVETSFIISTPVDNGYRVTPSPLPVPVSTPVPVPVANPVPNPVANPVPVPIAVPVAIPVPRPVANPVPVPVYVPVPVPADQLGDSGSVIVDDSSASSLSLLVAFVLTLLALAL